MKPLDLTPKQAILFRYLKTRQADGVGPTYTDMMAITGHKSKSGIATLVRGLEQRGLIRRLFRRHQAIEVVCETYFRWDDKAKALVPYPSCFTCNKTLSREQRLAIWSKASKKGWVSRKKMLGKPHTTASTSEASPSLARGRE